MRILIYGAGVIGSLYAVLLAKAGIPVDVYARGSRLETLRSKGLLYRENGNVRRAEAGVIDRLAPEDGYDFIFLTVRETGLRQALTGLAANKSDIVTFVNAADGYESLEALCGAGRLIPAFPGAGGSIEDGILDAGLTPAFIQPTVFGEITGQRSARTDRLAGLFRQAKIPCRFVRDMHLWQLCHLAMVVPIADAYYEAAVPERAGRDRMLMRRTAERIRDNLRRMKRLHGGIAPKRMYLFLLAPLPLTGFGLSVAFNSAFGERFMYRHAMKAPDEMRALHERLYAHLVGRSA